MSSADTANLLLMGGLLLAVTVGACVLFDAPELAALLIAGVIALVLIIAALQHPIFGIGIGAFALSALAIGRPFWQREEG